MDAGGLRLRASPRDRAGHVPVWVPLVLCVSVLGWLLVRLELDAEDEGFAEIDPRRTRIEDGPGFVDPRWRPALSARLASLPSLPAQDPESGEAIRRALASLPFVAAVGEGRVLWPDGFEVPVKLRVPAACVRVEDHYLAVAEDGVILPGAWTRPPWVGAGWLPAILEDPDGGPVDLDRARPGERLARPEHLDALAVAVSMRSALTAEDFETMGAPAIDATHARRASVEDPGVVLHLEQGRTVYFGRAPGSGEPGELPEDRKWEALRLALRAIRATTADARDWDLLDVRWDVPDVLWREAAPGSAEGFGGAQAPGLGDGEG